MHADLFFALVMLPYAGSGDFGLLSGFFRRGFGKRSDAVMLMTSVGAECFLFGQFKGNFVF